MSIHNGKGMANPDEAAVTFYAFQQMMAVLASKYDRNEPLPEDDLQVMNEYLYWCEKEAIRAAMYLLIIIIRESRHTYDNANMDSVIASDVGPSIVKWLRQYKSGENYTSLWTDPPKGTFGQLVRAIRRFFYEQKFSGGYGGPAWGGIADCLESYITGKTSLEIMLDTNWTLSHNNGPIFNKGMLYTGYEQTLKNILDVQRAGMIIEGILEKHSVIKPGLSNSTDMRARLFVKRHPEAFPVHYIDWYKVEALGAVNSCKYYQKQQNQIWGLSPAAEEAQKIAFQKAEEKKKQDEMAELAKKQAQEEFLKTHYQVDVHTYVKKINRAA
ncbi:hypothetical protein EVB27_135 [Rhizobium phage RHph_TM16]|nr:hypothetical protein EVB27_135 [Rhizobium phage RHph_TM16]